MTISLTSTSCARFALPALKGTPVGSWHVSNMVRQSSSRVYLNSSMKCEPLVKDIGFCIPVSDFNSFEISEVLDTGREEIEKRNALMEEARKVGRVKNASSLRKNVTL